MTLLIILVPILLVIFIIISIRNGLIAKKNKVEYANGAVDAMFKQRYDLIPNLVASVKQYMQHESGVLERLVQLRSQAKQSNLSDEQRNNINKELDQAFRSFNITVESYPNLKASEQFSKLQASLNECEGQLAAARRTYNAAVMEYNNAIEMFPSSIFASQMKYVKKEMITSTEQERINPNVGNLFQ